MPLKAIRGAQDLFGIHGCVMIDLGANSPLHVYMTEPAFFGRGH